MSKIFHENHYRDYCNKISELNLSAVKDILGIEFKEDKAVISFFNDEYFVSGSGIEDASGNRPDYLVCVVLSKYLLLCPKNPSTNEEWSTLKDLNSQFTNINVFKSDAEHPIVKNFTGRVDELKEAAQRIGCIHSSMDISYDVSMEIQALPKIKILLLFNDGDEDFPASASILYQRRSADYLDPESLIMTGLSFTKRLNQSLSLY